MRKLIAFLLGFALGAMIAVVIGTLLAPESGEDTRGRIEQYIQHVLDEGKRAASDRQAELESQLEQLKQGKSWEEVA